MEIHLRIAGILLILLAFIHVVLPRYFKWQEQTQRVTLITRQILYVHTFFIGFAVFLMGILCLSYPTELTGSPFGRILCLGLFAFWFTRLIFQFFVYSPALWKGKRFETIIHVTFSALWSYFSIIFIIAYLQE
jgi:hypothetical protein